MTSRINISASTVQNANNHIRCMIPKQENEIQVPNLKSSTEKKSPTEQNHKLKQQLSPEERRKTLTKTGTETEVCHITYKACTIGTA